MAALRSRKSRIVVCVGIVGEGVDLPALKIAALHDAHRSLTVTLQFVGRLTRTGGPYVRRRRDAFARQFQGNLGEFAL
jgi:superfamily II DNA or RNA helicase